MHVVDVFVPVSSARRISTMLIFRTEPVRREAGRPAHDFMALAGCVVRTLGRLGDLQLKIVSGVANVLMSVR
eukprot:scaffold11680_cov142-Cylindrotheca_fusiformis.AAC.12